MKTGRMAWISGLTIAAAAGLAACSKPATPSSDLSRDLDAAETAPSLTLAPSSSGRRDVISDVERAPEARRAPAPSRAQLVVHRTVTPPPPAAVTPQPAAVTPAQVTPAQVAAEVPAAPAPETIQPSQSRRPTPVQQDNRRYKTEAEVFRDAPFPITP